MFAVNLILGRIRHRLEEQLWRTEVGARWLLRRDLALLDRYRASDPVHPFTDVEKSVFSQNGEDGILAHVFAELGVSNGRFVEIGAADGQQNCTRALAENGWQGLWVEGDPELAAQAQQLDLGGRVNVVAEMVGPDDIVGILRRERVPPAIDLLVVDIDSCDYWIVEAVLNAFRAAVVVVEINGEHRWPWVHRPKRARKGESPSWDRSWNYGASLGAYNGLLSSYGYSLVGCDSAGVNAFFVRTASLPPSLEVAPWPDRYVPPSHRPGSLGHPRQGPAPPTPPAPGSTEQLEAISFPRVEVVGAHVRGPGAEVLLLVDVRNDSDVAIASAGEVPYRLAYTVFDGDGDPVDEGEPRRSLLASVVEPDSVRPSGIEVVLPRIPGRYVVVPTVVQEGVAWRRPVPAEGVEVWVDS